MKTIRLTLCPTLGVAIVVGTLGMTGCSPEGTDTASAPKVRKSNEDEI
jgi:hypothetical protein